MIEFCLPFIYTIQSLLIEIAFHGRIFLIFLIFMSYYRDKEMIIFIPYAFFFVPP